MKKFIKCNLIYIIVFISLFILNTFLIVGMDSQKLENTINIFTNDFGKIAFGITCTSIIPFALLLKRNNDNLNKIKLETIFIILSVVLGIFYIIVNPFERVPDEKAHFIRSYEISKGKLISQELAFGKGGGIWPEALVELVYGYVREPDNIDYSGENYAEWMARVSKLTLDNPKNVGILYPNTAIYTFISYLPQAIGIFIADLFTNNILSLMYVGRFFNLLVYSVLMYFSIKLIPSKKQAVFLIGLLPIIMQEAGSFAVDSLIIALSFFYVSYILNIVYNKEKIISKKNMIILFITSVCIATVKIVYLPICFAILLIPKEKFKNKKTQVIYNIIVLLASVIVNIGWLIFTFSYEGELVLGVNPIEQVKYIFANVFRYIFVMVRSTNYWLESIIGNITGTSLAMFDVSVGNIYKTISLVLILYVLLCDNHKDNKVNIKTKIIFLLCLICVVGLIYTSEYVKWTPVGSKIIEGLQGRYFLPLFVFLPFIFDNDYVHSKNKLSNRMLTLLIVFLNLHAINCLLFSVMI